MWANDLRQLCLAGVSQNYAYCAGMTGDYWYACHGVVYGNSGYCTSVYQPELKGICLAGAFSNSAYCSIVPIGDYYRACLGVAFRALSYCPL